jgi:hypothetical protein
MQIPGMNIKSDIFNTTKSTISDLTLPQWGKVYRRTPAMLDGYRPTKEAFKDSLALVHTVQKVHQNIFRFFHTKRKMLSSAGI